MNSFYKSKGVQFRYAKLCLIGLSLFLVVLPTLGDNSTAKIPPKIFKMGLLPYLSPSELMKTWKPLAVYLKKILGADVVLKTAPNFDIYFDRTANNQYDFLLTAPHFAWYAESKHKYRRIAGFAKPLSGDIFINKKLIYHTASDLKGKSFATPDHLAIITLLGEFWLTDQGIDLNKDITVKYTPSHNNVLISVAEGLADIGVAVKGLFYSMPLTVKDQLKIIGQTQAVPHTMFIASPRIEQNDFDAIKRALFHLNDTEDGRDIIENIGWGALIDIPEESMKQLETMMPLFETRINAQK